MGFTDKSVINLHVMFSGLVHMRVIQILFFDDSNKNQRLVLNIWGWFWTLDILIKIKSVFFHSIISEIIVFVTSLIDKCSFTNFISIILGLPLPFLFH